MYRIQFILNTSDLIQELRVKAMASLPENPQCSVTELVVAWFNHRLDRYHFLLPSLGKSQYLITRAAEAMGPMLSYEPSNHRNFYWAIEDILNRFPSLKYEVVEIEITQHDLYLRFHIESREHQ